MIPRLVPGQTCSCGFITACMKTGSSHVGQSAPIERKGSGNAVDGSSCNY